MMKRLLSTTTVARLLGVAVASVANWIDHDQLKAGRTPGGHRKVTVEDLVEFLQRQKLPIPPELLQRKPRILLVDDEPAVTQWLATELRVAHPEYEVHEAHDGYVAGELVGAWKPDVVILDLRMPGMDGFEVCRRISSKPENKGTTIIAMTGRPSPKLDFCHF